MTKGDDINKRYVVFEPTEKLRCTHTHITLADAKRCELFVTRKRSMLLHVPKEWIESETPVVANFSKRVSELLPGYQAGVWHRLAAADVKAALTTDLVQPGFRAAPSTAQNEPLKKP